MFDIASYFFCCRDARVANRMVSGLFEHGVSLMVVLFAADVAAVVKLDHCDDVHVVAA